MSKPFFLINEGKDSNLSKARKFMSEVKKLADKYNLPVFAVTDGASITKNNGCKAVQNARNAHAKWESKNGLDPNEDWGKEIKKD
jgi:hypothetical protein